MQLLETRAFGTVEGFLDCDECIGIVAEMATYLAGLPLTETDPTRRSRSIHSVPGLTLQETMSVYEPAGRTEICDPPDSVVKLMDGAFLRNRIAIRRMFGSVSKVDSWTYLEYCQGQYITPHVDCPEDPAFPSRVQVGGISVTLDDGYQGGEFVVTTSSDDRLFGSDDADDRVVVGADYSSPWFRALVGTDWVCRPRAGTGVCYGSQLIHSTRPVTAGVARKLIGFFVV